MRRSRPWSITFTAHGAITRPHHRRSRRRWWPCGARRQWRPPKFTPTARQPGNSRARSEPHRRMRPPQSLPAPVPARAGVPSPLYNVGETKGALYRCHRSGRLFPCPLCPPSQDGHDFAAIHGQPVPSQAYGFDNRLETFVQQLLERAIGQAASPVPLL